MNKARRLAVLLVAAFGLAFAAGADEGNHGVGDLTAKNAKAGTVTIEDRTFRVTDRTIIEDLLGQPLTFAEIPAPGFEAGDVSYEYEAVGRGGKPTLHLLRMVESPR